MYPFRDHDTHRSHKIFDEIREKVIMNIEWIEGYKITVKAEENEVLISANIQGLLSLAKQLVALAKEDAGSHIHYDENNSLEDGSAELIIEKI